MMLRVHSIAVEESEAVSTYTAVVERPDGEIIQCTFEAFEAFEPGDYPSAIVVTWTRETVLALLEYEAPAPPGTRGQGALVIPVLERMNRLVMAFSRGEPIEFPVELSTERDHASRRTPER